MKSKILLEYYEKLGAKPHFHLVYCTGKCTKDHGEEGVKHISLRVPLSFYHGANAGGDP